MDTSLLIDFGDLYSPEQFPEVSNLLITHKHPDHIGGILKDEFKEKKELYDHVSLYLSNQAYVKELPSFLKVTKFKRRDSFKIGSFNITSVPVLHSVKAPNVALFISDNKHKICYCSDVVSIRKADRDKYLKGCSVFIGDLSTHKKGGLIRKAKHDEGTLIGHADIRTQLAWCRDAGVPVCIFTHLGTDPIELGDGKLKDLLSTLENKYGVKIIIAKDGDKYDIEDLVNMSERELLREELQLKPEDVEPITPKAFPKTPEYGLILVAPHPELIWKGEKTAIVKSVKLKSHINEPLYLLDIKNKLCYGIIQLKEPVEISREDFIKRYDEHRVSEEERKRWAKKEPSWNKFPLYLYEFFFTKFEAPKPIRVKVKGPQIFIKASNIEFLSPKLMTMEELEYFHSYYHSCGELLSPCCKEHYVIALEMLNRGIPHLSRTPCDRPIELITKETAEYIRNIKDVEDRPLGDDFRIVLAWYSSIRRGKKLKRKDGTPITIEDCRKLGLAIVKEMIRRHKEYEKKGITKFTFNKPETYKKYARELFEWIIKQIGKDNIPWKEEKELNYISQIYSVLPAGMRIEDIDPPYVIGLTDEELIKLWEFLVDKANESASSPETIPENIHDAGVFVGIELYKRGLWDDVKGDNILTKAVELEVSEYPTPKGLFFSEAEESEAIYPEPEGEYIKLEDVLKALPPHLIVKGEPYGAYLTGRIVNEGRIPKDHDIDLLFRQLPDPRIVEAVKNLKPEWLARRIHPVFDPFGPYIGYSLNVYRYGFFKLPDNLMIRDFGPYRFEKLAKEIKVGKPMIGVKPRSGFGKFEFWDPEEMYREWASKYLEDGIFVQEKVDGRRMQLHVDKAKKLVKIITEDRQRDRASQFPNIVKEIMDKLNCESCILDGEMVAFEIPPNKVVKSAKLKRQMDLMEREDTAAITVGKVPPELEDRIVYVFYDIMYLDGKPVVDLPYSERFKLLKKVVPRDARYLDLVRSIFTDTPGEFLRAVEKMRRAPGSEGVVAKAATMKYPVKYKGENRSDEMCITGGSYILTEEGFKKVCNLKVGDLVFAKDGKLHRVLRILKRLVGSEEKLYDVRSKNPGGIKVRLTGDHRVMTREGWERAENINNKLGVPIRISLPEEPYPKRLELEWHGYKKIIKCTDDFWKFIGFWLAEGSLGNNRCKSYKRGELTFSQKDPKVFEYYADLADKLLGVKGKRYQYNGINIYIVWDKPFCDWLSRHFLDRNDDKTIPWFIGSLPESSFNALWNGYRDGDRCHKFSDDIITSDPSLAGRMYAILLHRNETVSVVWRKTRKRNSFIIRRLKRPITSYRIEAKRVYTDKKDWVYDIEVEGEESFLSGNIVLHNCKLKNLKEIDVMVWDVIEKKRKETGEPLGSYMYISVYLIPEEKVDDFPKNKVVEYKGKHYAIIGRTYATNVKCKRGDIITVMPIRIRRYESKEGKYFYTWMFPYFKEKRSDKKDPDTLTTVERIAKLGTRPAKLTETLEETIVVKLPICEFSEYPEICPLKKIFGKPRYHELTILKIEHLRFPVACPLANIRRCVFLKDYYYGFKTYKRGKLSNLDGESNIIVVGDEEYED